MALSFYHYPKINFLLKISIMIYEEINDKLSIKMDIN